MKFSKALGVLVPFLFQVSALGDTPTETIKEETKVIKNQISEARGEILEAEVKKRGILGTLYDINKELARLDEDIDSVQTQLDKHRKAIESSAKVIVRLEKVLAAEKQKLKDRLRALYKLGLRGYAEILLSSQTSAEFSRNMKFLKIISDHDRQMIKNYQANVDMLSEQQSKMRTQVRVYAEFQTKLRNDKTNYDKQKAQQVRLLAQIDQDRDSHVEAIREWREAGKKLEEQLVQLGLQPEVSTDFSRATFFEQKGQLISPVGREILQRYGIVKNEKFNTKIFHKGLFFAAKPKDQVGAIFWGKVVFAGWIDGYGETLIIDHGDHYYSLYAHNSRLEKKAGEAVKPGEEIALAGDTGSLRGPGLYLEIRHFSESLDPLPWLDLNKASRL